MFDLYKGETFHKRDNLQKKRFINTVYWFSLDVLNDNSRSKLSRNLYSLKVSDHINFGYDSIEKNIKHLISDRYTNDDVEITSVTYYGLLRSLGYLFNPVCLFIVKSKKFSYAVVEVGNTFGEMKPFVHQFGLDEEKFDFTCPKYFYVSPFIQHNANFRFRFTCQGDQLSFSAQTLLDNKILMNAGFNAQKIDLKLFNPRLLFQSFLVIFLIHLYALILWLKGQPYFRKKEYTSYQKGMYLWKKH